MNQEQLIDKTAANIGLQKTIVTRCLDGLLDAIADTLASGESVSIRRFGSFRVSQHQERNGINPHTLKPIIIPAIGYVKFTGGSELLSKVRGE